MKKTITLLLMWLVIPLTTFGQSGNLTPHEGIPEYYFDVVNVNSDKAGLSRLNVYFEIPYDELQFIKLENAYQAKYEVSVVVYDKDGDQIDGKIWQEEVTVVDYDETNTRKKFSFTHNSFHLKPKEYRISIGFMDLDSKKTATRKGVVKLKDFQDEKLSVSEITMADNILVDSLGVKSIHPQVAEFIKAAGTELYCYFEIYSSIQKKEDIIVSYKIVNAKKETVHESRHRRERKDYRTMDYIKLHKQKLSHGKYTIELEVKHGGKKDKTKKAFVVRWTGVPSTVVDLDLATRQLMYIASKDEIEKIKKAGKAEKIIAFESFWKKKDPTPGTARNELMEEYYRRIEYSNANFGSYREGWKTDMGMVYIILGPPNDIERHPFERDYKPYEIWYYYQLNRQFIFIDETGYGEYRLRNPFWREWQQDGIYF